jgi:hypothetical protein
MSDLIDLETLNAYVDGELEPADAAVVMDAVAANPAIARELSALMRAKAALAESVEAPEIALPRGPAARPVAVRAALAAALVLGVALTAVLRVAAPGISGPLDIDWTVAAHNAWSSTGQPAMRPVTGAGLTTVSSRVTGQAYIPDLTSARLYIAHVGRQTGGKSGGALIVGYRGTRGCTVTLAVSQRLTGLSEEIRPVEASHIRGYAWRAGKFGYYVLAEGMSAARLKGIAYGIHEASLRHLPLTTETQSALARSRAQSPPCHA